MKRIGNLFDQFCAFSNLLAAAKRARRGTRLNGETAGFMVRLEYELLRLQEELHTLSYQPRPYRYFEIFDPKHRTISVAAFRDRVVHHALVAVLEPVFERIFIPDSYATRKEKGTLRAVSRAQQLIRHNRWFLKSDIEHYFDSIDHDILLGLLQHKIKDKRLLEIAERIIRNGGLAGKGLPIGNLTSQFFANVYLHPLDYFVQYELGFRAYIRYMDDFVLFHAEKERLKTVRPLIENFLNHRLRLRLKPSATYLNSASNGLSFLGLRIFPGMIRIRPENGRRMMRRWRLKEHDWLAGRLEETALLASANSYTAFLSRYPVRKDLI